MAVCPYCGAVINSHYKYCPQCGKSQPEKHTGVTEVINGIQAELDRRMAQEEVKVSQEIDLSSWKVEEEPINQKAQPETQSNLQQHQPKEQSNVKPELRSLRKPDVGGLYEGYRPQHDREPGYEEDEEPYLGSRLLRGLILVVCGLLVVAVAFGLLLILHPLGNTAVEEPTSIAEEETTPEPTPEPTPDPTPEPTPPQELVEPVRGETEQLIYDLLTDYYHSYLTAINRQDASLLQRTSLQNQEAAKDRILSGPNAESIYAEDDFSVDVDMNSFQVITNGSIQVNAHMVFYCAPRSGGNSERVDSWQTFLLIEGTGDDGWIVDRSERLSQDDYINHKYAFLP